MRKAIISVILVVFMLFIGLCGCGQSGIGETGISLEEFNEIKIGMSLTAVDDIIGGEGEQISETDNSTDDYYEHVIVYKFYGETSGYAELEFTTHKDSNSLSFDKIVELTSKTQYDLS